LDGTINNEESLRRYLLGRLDEEEQTRIEEAYFDNAEYFASLQTIESELIDEYVGNRLAEKDRKDFEECFLQSAGRREQVEFAQAFKLYLERQEHPAVQTQKISRKSFFDFLRLRPIYLLPVAASLILTVGFVFLLMQTARLRNQLNQAQQTLSETQQREQDLRETLSVERQRTIELAKELDLAHNQQTQASGDGTGTPNPLAQIIAVTLSNEGVRDQGGIKKIILPAGAETLRVTMVYSGGDYKKVTASLKRGGREVVNPADLAVRPYGLKKQSVWPLPAKALSEGDYLITLSATNPAGETEETRYAFRILKK
jgi:cell division protein FtsL